MKNKEFKLLSKKMLFCEIQIKHFDEQKKLILKEMLFNILVDLEDISIKENLFLIKINVNQFF